jgi:hypothetical protein
MFGFEISRVENTVFSAPLKTSCSQTLPAGSRVGELQPPEALGYHPAR